MKRKIIEEITNGEFTTEMKILWQNSDVETRNLLMEIIRNYFDCGDRATKIMQKMQCQI